MKQTNAKILVKQNKKEQGFGNVAIGKLLISYEIPMLFAKTATLEGIETFLDNDLDKQNLRDNWKLVDAIISF